MPEKCKECRFLTRTGLCRRGISIQVCEPEWCGANSRQIEIGFDATVIDGKFVRHEG